MTTSQAVAKWKLSGEMFPLAKAFIHNTMYLVFTSKDHQNNKNNDSLLLLFDGLGKVKADYMV